MNLTKMSKVMGVCVNTIRWHEAGDRMLRADQLVQAAEYLGVPPAQLINPAPEATPEEA